MDDNNSQLLPFILQTLTQKPESCDTFENLCDEVKYIFSAEDLQSQCGDIQDHLQNALVYGQKLGILTLDNDVIRVPIDFNEGTKTSPNLKKPFANSPENEGYSSTQPRRRNAVKTAAMIHSRRKSGSRRQRRSRRRR